MECMQEGPLVGITSTIPSEVVYAAGMCPVDLNNAFITAPDPDRLLSEAENAGFPRTVCAWIKGIYGAVLEGGLERVIVVTGGDCSNAIALADVLEHRGVSVDRFDYPPNRSRDGLEKAVNRLTEALGARRSKVGEAKQRLDRIRTKLQRLDRMTYQEDRVNGLENHLFLVSSSDFNSDPEQYEAELDAFLAEAGRRVPQNPSVRLGYVGVPPIFSDLYETLERLGARVVFNEVQRQFSLPGPDRDLLDCYLDYTYPYDIGARIQDIRQAVRERRLHGIIHYTQTFCHRQIHDILIREAVEVPVLTLEGDRPGGLDGRTLTRVETFLEMLKGL
jgi:benzoyl-CoA reductase/2-hydroxyglutaryl-CoA dehydratase subunit BcrC/BadD/HgdB